MKQEHSAGGVVYRRSAAEGLSILLILDKYGAWTLPKGHLEQGESEAQAAQREIAEESGVLCEIGPLIQRIEYEVLKKGQLRSKQTAFFLAAALSDTLVPSAEEGIAEARWCSPDQALQMIGYDKVREVARQALEMLRLL